MRVKIDNVVSLKIEPVRAVGRSDIQMPFTREIRVETGNGDVLTIELGAWYGTALRLERKGGR